MSVKITTWCNGDNRVQYIKTKYFDVCNALEQAMKEAKFLSTDEYILEVTIY